MAAPTCCIDTSKSRSGSAESVHRVLLAASKHKRRSGSDETKRRNYEEKTRYSPWECTRPRLLSEGWARIARILNHGRMRRAASFASSPVVSSLDRKVKIARMLLALLTTQQAVVLRKNSYGSRMQNRSAFSISQSRWSCKAREYRQTRPDRRRQHASRLA